jgi:hypothetical protein
MIDSSAGFVRLVGTGDAQGHAAEAAVPSGKIQKRRGMVSLGIALKHERPAAIRLAGQNGQGARDLRERMDAILKPETMAGSPDADAATRAASRNLAHGFLFFGVPSFGNT